MPERSAVGCLGGVRVLIAEDDGLLADTWAVLLEEEGARILGPYAASAPAIDCVRSGNIDFALVDMNLIDNFADGLLQELAVESIPCAVLTGFYALPSNCLDLAVQVFRKPVEIRDVIDLICKHLPRNVRPGL